MKFRTTSILVGVACATVSQCTKRRAYSSRPVPLSKPNCPRRVTVTRSNHSNHVSVRRSAMSSRVWPRRCQCMAVCTATPPMVWRRARRRRPRLAHIIRRKTDHPNCMRNLHTPIHRVFMCFLCSVVLLERFPRFSSAFMHPHARALHTHTHSTFSEPNLFCDSRLHYPSYLQRKHLSEPENGKVCTMKYGFTVFAQAKAYIVFG